MDESKRQEIQSLNDTRPELFLVTKTKRIFAAINKITEFLEGEEPLRLNLRDSACELLGYTLSLTESTGLKNREVIKDIYERLNRIMSYIDVLVMSGWLSETNREILKDEILSFKMRADTYAHEHSGLVPIEHLFDQASLGVTDSGLFVLPEPARSAGLNRPAMLINMNNVMSASGSARSGFDHNAGASERIMPHESQNDSQKDKRKSAIFDYIKKRGAATVRDLVPVIKGCSEKTIQRELAALVSAGALRKEGERRWSKYYLAHTL